MNKKSTEKRNILQVKSKPKKKLDKLAELLKHNLIRRKAIKKQETPKSSI